MSATLKNIAARPVRGTSLLTAISTTIRRRPMRHGRRVSHPESMTTAVLAWCIFSVALLLGGTSGFASAAQITGISDQNMAFWAPGANGAFNAMNLPQVRYITAWDVALHEHDAVCGTPCQRFHELNAWIAKAQSQGKQILISFDYQVGCNKCDPPSGAEYADAVWAFLQRFPGVREFTAWNEPNHDNDKRKAVPGGMAAQYWKILNSYCQLTTNNSCTVAAGDLNHRANLRSYTTEYKAALAYHGVTPGVWAVHPYYAVEHNDFGQGSSIRDWLDNYTSGKPVWISEIGALYCSEDGLKGATPQAALEHQRVRAGYLSAFLQQAPARVQRAYYYFLAKPNGGQEACPGFDSALFGGNDAPRPALTVLFPNLPPPDPCSGVSCDDGNACTADSCNAGSCSHAFSSACLTPILSLLLDDEEPPMCGNRIVEVGEQCDDGNTTAGDCCSATCSYEPTSTICGTGCDGKVCDGAGVCR